MNAIAFTGAVAPLAAAPRPRLSRNAVIALSVVVLHLGFIWALQSGLLMRSVELIVPAEVLSQLMDAPAPKVEPAPPTPPAPPVPQKQTSPAVHKKHVARAPAQPQAQPLAVADTAPAAEVAAAVVTAAPAEPAPAAAAPGPTAPPAPAVQLPSSNADYLQNPKPTYPALSKRLGEQGKVIVRVLIGVDGTAHKAEIRQSSGFERLDQAALNTVLKWRYVPGKRAGVAEDMWFNVPINFVLE